MKLIISKKFSDQIDGLKIATKVFNKNYMTEKNFRTYWKIKGKNKLNEFIKITIVHEAVHALIPGNTNENPPQGLSNFRRSLQKGYGHSNRQF